MFLRDLVGKWFIEYRTDLFNMEVGRLAYDLLDRDPSIEITDKVSEMTNMQRLIILRCIISKIDYTPIISKNFNHKQMEELRQYLLRGMDIDIVNDEKINHEVMRLVRNALSKGIKVPSIPFADYSYEQIDQILVALNQELDITPLLNNQLTDDEMMQIRSNMLQVKLSEKARRDTEYYANLHNNLFGHM